MSRSRLRSTPELSAGSMADIAFLLLTFYMVTTVINDEKGVALKLPPYLDAPPVPVHERNLFKVQINSHDQFLIQGEPQTNLSGLREAIKKFVLNRGSDEHLSDSPDEAVVSLKSDRGTSYRSYILALDEIQAAYYELYADQAGVSPERFRSLDLNNPAERKIHERGRKGIPMNISIAEPNR